MLIISFDVDSFGGKKEQFLLKVLVFLIFLISQGKNFFGLVVKKLRDSDFK